MAGRGPTAEASGRPDARLGVALAVTLAVGFVVRAQVSLLPALLTGDDGAYYLVQVRGILRDGRLPIPDFPLLFYVQATIARILSIIADQRTAIVAAVRWTDATVPVLLAVPAYLFVRSFARGAGASRPGAVLAVVFTGIAATMSGNALFTAGGAIKNGCALPFSLLFLFHLHRAIEGGGRRSVIHATAFLLISSLTHVSALALNGALCVLVVAAALLTLPIRGQALRPAAVAAAVLAGLVGAAVLFDPDRAYRLLGVLVHPGRFFTFVSDPTSLPADFNARLDRVVTLPFMWTGNALGALGAYVLWRYRTDAEPATRVILWATTLTTLFFSFPLLAPDLLERLAAVAFVPGLVPLAFLLCRSAAATVVVAPLAALSVVAGALTVKTALVTALVQPAYEELERLGTALPAGRSMVIASHGLEWWVVWTLDTHFSNSAALALARRTEYDAVLLIEQTGPGAFGRRATRVAGGTPGAAVRDGVLLRTETLTTLAEGRFFRLSRVERRP